MSSPVIVQGTAVASPYDHGSPVDDHGSPVDDFTKGEKQESRCRDAWAAVLLYINVAAMAGVAATLGKTAIEGVFAANSDVSEGSEVDLSGYANATAVTGVVSLVFAGLSFLVLLAIPQFIIKFSLFFSIGGQVAIAAACIYYQVWIAAGISVVFLLLTLCYIRAVWSRIPFATINLITATTAVKKNCGVVFFSYLSVAMAAGWSILWIIAFAGVTEDSVECAEENGETVCQGVNGGIYFAMLLSYFFTHQVIQNTIHVVIAGVVGTWWFAPDDASSCCSAGIFGSIKRALTTSFGSICLGSLLVAIIQALRALADSNNDGEPNMLSCLVSCILGCLEGILEYFNKWAFIYVGLYGYGYMDAGKNVIQLFKSRGWSALIADDLVGRALATLSLVVGLLAGAVGVILATTTDWFDANDGSDGRITSFVLGLIIGLVLTSIALSSIASGVNAVIVLFAEAPAEFEQHHPELSRKMRDTWQSSYPGINIG